MIAHMKAPLKRRSRMWRTRYQALAAGAVVFLQAIIKIFIPTSQYVSPDIIILTSILCFFATLIGIFLIKTARNYPGVEGFSYIIPSFFLSYGVLILTLTMLRIPYSRFTITSSFITSIIVLFILLTILRRSTKLQIGVVPEGDYAALTQIAGVTWLVLDRPDQKVEGLDAISVDLWRDLSDEWESRLASFALQGIPVYDLKHLRESLTGKVEIERLSENNLGTLSPLYAYMAMKHILDWICALAALVICLPILVLVAVAIKLDSRGPVIFRQIRIGYQGKPFWVYKFRTMAASRGTGEGGQAERHAAMTKDGDQRITRLGRFLRHSRIDELPQLVNVLRGEMTWIGPRPEAEVLSRWYEAEIPFYQYRHIVRPGITGWAQVNQGHVADIEDIREKLHFDFYYIKNFSPWIDFVIIGKTLRTIVTGFGSR